MISLIKGGIGRLNRRQAKKQFKKKYGMTPEEMKDKIQRAADTINAIDWEKIGKDFGESTKVFTARLKDSIQKFSDRMREFTEYIENMSEKEYQRWINSDELSNEAKSWLMLIQQQSMKKDFEKNHKKVQNFRSKPEQTEVNDIESK